MQTFKNENQLEMFQGLDEEVLEEIIKEGIIDFGSFVYAYNMRIGSNRKKIDASNRSSVQELADFLRNKGLEKEAKKFESLFTGYKRAEELNLSEKKPEKYFITHIEKTLPEDDK